MQAAMARDMGGGPFGLRQQLLRERRTRLPRHAVEGARRGRDISVKDGPHRGYSGSAARANGPGP